MTMTHFNYVCPLTFWGRCCWLLTPKCVHNYISPITFVTLWRNVRAQWKGTATNTILSRFYVLVVIGSSIRCSFINDSCLLDHWYNSSSFCHLLNKNNIVVGIFISIFSFSSNGMILCWWVFSYFSGIFWIQQRIFTT